MRAHRDHKTRDSHGPGLARPVTSGAPQHSVVGNAASLRPSVALPASPPKTSNRANASQTGVVPPRQPKLLVHKDLKTTMIYTHVLNRGGRGVRSPVDSLERSAVPGVLSGNRISVVMPPGTMSSFSSTQRELHMKIFSKLLLTLALIVGSIGIPAFAGDTDPLFVNLTTDDSHRANMAITFGKSQLERGHPLTIFLNDKGVFIGSKANAAKFADHQKALGELISKGAVVLVCPMCMKHYGVKEVDLLTGLKVGNPALTGGALFKDNTKTLTW